MKDLMWTRVCQTKAFKATRSQPARLWSDMLNSVPQHLQNRNINQNLKFSTAVVWKVVLKQLYIFGRIVIIPLAEPSNIESVLLAHGGPT